MNASGPAAGTGARLAGRRLGELSSWVELLPGVLAVGVLVLLAADGGGFAPTTWYPAALFLLGLLVVAGVVYRGYLPELTLANRLALLFLAAFTVWSFLSITWADQQGVAWEGANRTLLYLIVFALFSIVPWRVRPAAVVLGLYAVGLTTLGLIVLAHAAGSQEAALSLIDARFAEPTNYSNGVAALFVGGFWPAAVLASRRETPWPLRGLLLACAGVLLQLALLPQSRGALIVFPLAFLAYFALVPQRLRALQAALPVLVLTALSAAPILDVFTVADEGGDIGAALSSALDAILISAAALFVVGAALGYLDRRVEVNARVTRAASRTVAGGSALAALAGIVAFLLVLGSPIGWANDRWQDFKGGYDTSGFGESRFSGDLGSNRYDFWRVSLSEEFAGAPLTGGGADNFAVAYARERESDEEPLYPHGLPFRILAGTGLIGAALFTAALAAALVAAVQARRGAADSLARGLAAVGLASFVYWILHTSGDWFWSLPAISAPVLAWLGMAASLGRRRAAERVDREDAAPRSRVWPWAPAAALVLAAAFAVLSFGLPWTAARYVDSATAVWRSQPDEAFSRLDQARTLSFLSPQPDLQAGSIAVALDDPERAGQAYADAIEREPSNWYATLQLGTLDLLEGRTGAGLDGLRHAAELNPRDSLIQTALRRAELGAPLTMQEIDQRLLRRVCSVVGITHETRFCG